MILYHITDQSLKDDILRNGLYPSVGINSKLVQENTPFIYLSDKVSIPYWMILLGHKHPCVLQVIVPDIPEKSTKVRDYIDYQEYRYDSVIPSDCIKEISINKLSIDTRATMQDLVESYLDAYSNLTVNFAQHYQYDADDIDDLQDLIDFSLSLIVIMKRLDYTVYTPNEFIDIFYSSGDSGKYTFLDIYLDTSFKLYEQLLHYPSDKSSEVRQQLYQLILDKIPMQCLTINTGIWTG